ncbi:unnamed protein product [Larinioides sclopetarius]|uniref:Uncharacterized protein n=1 Tax=Larinioides sclopetarius TaxID=280406 RepID=A0AAV1YU30_9ARAC
MSWSCRCRVEGIISPSETGGCNLMTCPLRLPAVSSRIRKTSVDSSF